MTGGVIGAILIIHMFSSKVGIGYAVEILLEIRAEVNRLDDLTLPGLEVTNMQVTLPTLLTSLLFVIPSAPSGLPMSTRAILGSVLLT